MKKIISILLIVLTMFSFATVAFAEGETEEKTTFTVKFEYNLEDGSVYIDIQTVPYGTDLDTVAPKTPSYVYPYDNTKLAKFDYWRTNHPAFKDEVEITNLPVIDSLSNIDEITFVAHYKYVENDIKNQTQEKVEDLIEGTIPGATDAFKDMASFFTSIGDLLKNWFSLFIFYIQSFFG